MNHPNEAINLSRKQKNNSNKKTTRDNKTGSNIANPVIRDVLLIVLVGVAARFFYDITLSSNPFFGKYILDSLVLHSWAVDIIGGTTSDLAYFRAPLFPYFLAALYKIFGTSSWSIILVQNIIGIGTAVLVYRFATELSNRRIALIAGLTTVLYPTLIYFEGETMITTLAVFLYTLSIYTMWKATEDLSFKNIFIAGIVFGLASITRPTILPLAVIFPLALLVKYGRSQLLLSTKQTLIFAAAILIPILPITFRNALIGGEPVLISTQGGVNFYIGNCKGADGLSVISLGPQLRLGKYEDNIWTSSMDEAKRRTGKELSQSEVSSFWFGEAFKWIADNPGQATKLYFNKLYLFWHGQEIFNNKSLYFAGEHSPLISITLWQAGLNFPSGLLFPLMLVGIFAIYRSNRQIFVPASYLLLSGFLMSFFFVCSRFRQPLIPIAIIIAVLAIEKIIKLLRKKNKFGYLSSVTVLLAIVLFNCGGNIESAINRSQFHAILGGIYDGQQDSKAAVENYEIALELVPDNMQVFSLLGDTYLKINENEKAREIFGKAVDIFPEYSPYNFGLGRSYQKLGDFEKAKESYKLTLEHSPKFAAAMDRLGYIYQKQNKPDSALIFYRMLLTQNPRNARLKQLIQQIESSQ